MISVEDSIPAGLDHDSSACMGLWASVFRVGVIDAARAFFMKESCPEEFHSALYWLNDETSYRPGSFLWLCELFDVDPDRTRSMVRMKFRELARSTDVPKSSSKVRAALEE